MKKYAFAIVIENEVAEILYADEDKESYINMLRSSPVVIDITNLGYYPDNESVWDGVNFKTPGTSENSVRPMPVAATAEALNEKFIVAWTVGNVCKMRTMFSMSLSGEAYYAALLSNPVFIELQESEIGVVLPGWVHDGTSFVGSKVVDFNPDIPPPL